MITSATERRPFSPRWTPKRQGCRRMPSETPASGVSEVPATPGPGVPRKSSATPCHGQLRHPQTPEGKGVAETASPVRASLCPHQFQLAQSGGAWFGHLDSKAIRRGVFLSVADLEASINAFLDAWNNDPNPLSGPPQSNPSRKN